MVDTTIVHRVYKPTNIIGGHHIVRKAVHGSIDDHHTPLGFLDSSPTAQHSKPQLFPISPRYFRPSFQQFPRCFVHALFDHATWPWPFPTLAILALDWREPPQKHEKKAGKDGETQKSWTHRDSPTQHLHQIQVALEEASPHRATGTGTPGRHRRPRAAGGRFGGHVVGDTDDAIGVRRVCGGLLGSWRNVRVQASTSWKMVRIFELNGLRFQSTDLNLPTLPTLAGEIRIFVGWNPISLVGQLHMHRLESTVIPFLRY